MKKTSLVAICAAALLASCSGNRTDKVEIDNFVVDQTIKSACAYYAVTPDDSMDMEIASAYIAVSIQWPEKLGEHSLRVLQDSLMTMTFGCRDNHTSHGIDAAIQNMVNNTSIFEYDELTYTRVDSLTAEQENMMGLSYSTTAKILDLNQQTVTYTIDISAYLGGAHGTTVNRIFTYDLGRERVLTSENMFVQGSHSALMSMIRQALADQFNVSVESLGDVIFVDQLTDIGQPYILEDAIVFHYNPYEIASYATGPIDVKIWAVELDDLLQPEVRDLINL